MYNSAGSRLERIAWHDIAAFFFRRASFIRRAGGAPALASGRSTLLFLSVARRHFHEEHVAGSVTLAIVLTVVVVGIAEHLISSVLISSGNKSFNLDARIV
jgi:hypothetical protein